MSTQKKPSKKLPLQSRVPEQDERIKELFRMICNGNNLAKAISISMIFIF